MPPRLRLFFSILTGVLLLLPALALYRELSRRSDIWWTPPPMALSLSESQDRVEIYVRGKPLGALLEAKQLSVADAAFTAPDPSKFGCAALKGRIFSSPHPTTCRALPGKRGPFRGRAPLRAFPFFQTAA